ncbi:hypothetical protein IWQ62_006037, partial [Dispira parvispora]
MTAPPPPPPSSQGMADEGPIPFFASNDGGNDWLNPNPPPSQQQQQQPPVAHSSAQKTPQANGYYTQSQVAPPPPENTAHTESQAYGTDATDYGQYDASYQQYYANQGYTAEQPGAEGQYSATADPNAFYATQDGQNYAGYYDQYGYYTEDGTYVPYDTYQGYDTGYNAEGGAVAPGGEYGVDQSKYPPPTAEQPGQAAQAGYLGDGYTEGYDSSQYPTEGYTDYGTSYAEGHGAYDYGNYQQYPSAEGAAQNQEVPELPSAATEIVQEKVQQPPLPEENVNSAAAFFDAFNPPPTEPTQQQPIPVSQATPLNTEPVVSDSAAMTPPPPVTQAPAQISTPGPAETGQSAFDFFENISSTAGTPVPSGGEKFGVEDQPPISVADVTVPSAAAPGPSQPVPSSSPAIIATTTAETPIMTTVSSADLNVISSAPVETLPAEQVSSQAVPSASPVKQTSTLESEAPVSEVAPVEEDAFSVIDHSATTGSAASTSTTLPGQANWQVSMGDLDDLVLGQPPRVDEPSTQSVPSTISPTPPSVLADSLPQEPVPSAERQDSSLVAEPTP